jgi:hypothetical protein
MGVKRALRQGFRTLFNPQKEFEALHNRTFEDVAEDYILILLVAGVVAGIMSLVYRFIYSGYLSIFKGMSIDYWRLLNYIAGNSVSMFFFYLFAGTFLIFIITMIARIFMKGMKLTRLLSLMLYAITPLLFFGWVAPSMFLPLIIWSLFLLIAGFRVMRGFEGSSQKILKKK